jgi:hypothetical protein
MDQLQQDKPWGREMTGDQCREARERLDWTRLQLGTVADVPAWFIAAFEDGKTAPDFLAGYEVDSSAALESTGVTEIRWPACGAMVVAATLSTSAIAEQISASETIEKIESRDEATVSFVESPKLR